MNKNEVNQIHSHIIKTTKKVLGTDPLGTVQIGSIVESNLYGYKVQLNNSDSSSLFYADVIYPDSKYKTGDMVYLLKAEKRNGENLETKYFIFGLVDVVKQSYFNLSDAERFMMDESAQWLLNPEKSNLIIDDENIINSLKINLGLKLSCILTTKDKDLSEYGFKIDFLDSNENIKTTRTFTDQDINGAPFLLESSKQETVFVFTNEELDGVEKIAISFIGGDSWVEYLTLTAGELDTQITDFSVKVSLQDTYLPYFKDINVYSEPQSIGLQAAATYQGRELDTAGLKYYWFIEDSSIIDGSSGFNGLAGEGWRCLNETFKAGTVVNGDIVQKTYWKADDNKYLLENYPTNTLNTDGAFEIKIKCIVTYFYAVAESKEFIIRDYNQVNYTTEIKVVEGKSPLLSGEVLKIEATVKADNNLAKFPDNEINYIWYVNGEEVSDTSSKELIVGSKNSAKESETDNYYKMSADRAVVSCAPYFVKEDESEVPDSISESNTIEVMDISQENPTETTKYHYYVSKNRTTSFSEVRDDTKYIYYKSDNAEPAFKEADNRDFLNGDQCFYNYFLQSEIEENDTLFLYVATQNVWHLSGAEQPVREDDWTKPYLYRSVRANRPEEGSEELILIDNKSQNELNQIDTFNGLTQNGSSQGLFYADAYYRKTIDRKPVVSKEYYIKTFYYEPLVQKPKLSDGYYVKIKGETEKENFVLIDNDNKKDYLNEDGSFKEEYLYYIKNKENDTKYIQIKKLAGKPGNFTPAGVFYIWDATEKKYIENEEAEFSATTIYYKKRHKGYEQIDPTKITDLTDNVYYELVSKDGDVYINATYIQTGTLSVGPIGQERFYASIDNEEVKIAGFYVNRDYIFKGTKKKDDSVYLGPSGLWLGENFSVSPYGSSSISSGEVYSPNFSRTQTWDAALLDPETSVGKIDDENFIHAEIPICRKTGRIFFGREWIGETVLAALSFTKGNVYYNSSPVVFNKDEWEEELSIPNYYDIDDNGKPIKDKFKVSKEFLYTILENNIEDENNENYEYITTPIKIGLKIITSDNTTYYLTNVCIYEEVFENIPSSRASMVKLFSAGTPEGTARVSYYPTFKLRYPKGYYILGENIEFELPSASVSGYENLLNVEIFNNTRNATVTDNSKYSKVFSGTLDGKGFSMSKMKLFSTACMFGRAGENGTDKPVIKNISFNFDNFTFVKPPTVKNSVYTFSNEKDVSQSTNALFFYWGYGEKISFHNVYINDLSPGNTYYSAVLFYYPHSSNDVKLPPLDFKNVLINNLKGPIFCGATPGDTYPNAFTGFRYEDNIQNFYIVGQNTSAHEISRGVSESTFRENSKTNGFEKYNDLTTFDYYKYKIEVEKETFLQGKVMSKSVDTLSLWGSYAIWEGRKELDPIEIIIVEKNGVMYTIDLKNKANINAVVSGYSKGNSEIRILSSVAGKDVIKICVPDDNKSLDNIKHIKHIIIDSREKGNEKTLAIDDNAFRDFEDLEDIIIPNHIGELQLRDNLFPQNKIINLFLNWPKPEGEDEDTKVKEIKSEKIVVNYYQEKLPDNFSSTDNYWTNQAQGFKISCDDTYFIYSDKFKVTKSGVITATDVHLRGEINATSGTIAGFTIETGAIQYSDDKQPAKNIYLSGGTLKLGDQSEDSTSYFRYDADKGLSLAGEINATGGEIAGFKITKVDDETGFLSFGEKEKADSVYLGTDGIYLGEKFSVDANGNLKANGAIFSGNTEMEAKIKLTTTKSSSYAEITDAYFITYGEYFFQSQKATSNYTKTTQMTSEGNIFQILYKETMKKNNETISAKIYLVETTTDRESPEFKIQIDWEYKYLLINNLDHPNQYYGKRQTQTLATLSVPKGDTPLS